MSLTLFSPCTAAATIISRMAHDLDDLCRERDGAAVFPYDLVERGYAQETIDRHGDEAVRLASALRETRENDGPLCCASDLAGRTAAFQPAIAKPRVNTAIACVMTAAAVGGALVAGAAIVMQSRPTHNPARPVQWAGALR